MWELNWRLNKTATYWPSLFWLSQRFFPVLLGCSTGGLGAQPLWDMVLIPASSLQLIWTPTNLNFLSPGLYNNLTPTLFFCERHNFALNSTPWQSRLYPDISYFDSLAGSEVNLQHVETDLLPDYPSYKKWRDLIILQHCEIIPRIERK